MEIKQEVCCEKCVGCSNSLTKDIEGVQVTVCKCYSLPSVQWRRGNCVRATHIQKEEAIEFKLNPLKASKRKMGR